MPSQNFNWYWLGISKTKGGEWRWLWRWLSNNSLISWTNWKRGHPKQNKNCINVHTKGGPDREWISTNCASDKKSVICEKSTTPKSDILVTISNGTDGLSLGIPPIYTSKSSM